MCGLDVVFDDLQNLLDFEIERNKVS
jgi:hypothetical protein